jgi:peptidoglycan/LPS O-acetylase OafA/YrhL
MIRLLARAIALPKTLVRTTSSGRYVPQLDGLRTLAILPVLVWHALLRGQQTWTAHHAFTPAQKLFNLALPNGHVGVMLFFFVSGLVIAGPFLSPRPPATVAFLRRRILRLGPPYALVLLISLAMVSFAPVPPGAKTFHAAGGPSNLESFVASLFYLHGLLFHLNPRLLPPGWSLEIEFQFYLIAPALIWLYRRSGGPKARLILAAATCLALIVAVNLMEEAWGPLGVQRWLVIGHLYPFVLGIAAADLALNAGFAQAPRERILDLGLVAGLCMLLATASYYETPTALTERLVRDLATVPALLLVFAGAIRGKAGAALMGHPWMALIGGACYSIYLVHIPIMYPLSIVLGHVLPPASYDAAMIQSVALLLPISLCAGLAFYVAVERPFMAADWPQRLARRVAALALRPRPAVVRATFPAMEERR